MKMLGTFFLGIILFFHSSYLSLLEQIKAKGELRVVTRYGPTTYYEGPNGATGLEYELSKRFAEELGVELRIIVVDSFAEILQQVVEQKAHVAAAGLTINPVRKALIQFGPHYQDITQQLIYHQEAVSPPSDLADWKAHYDLRVVAGSNQVDFLKRLQPEYPQLSWTEVTAIEPGELLEQVWEQKIQYTIMDSNEVAQMRRFYPELQVGLEFPERQQVAWAFPRSRSDNSLYLAAIHFFNRLRRSGELDQLIERYYGHLDDDEQFDPFDIRAFHSHIKNILPKYREYFERIATRHHLDWRLLAAIGYQESKWNPNAVSATGVRGLMMLTQSTAREMEVKNREDPLESIQGGAKYFIATKKRIAKEILEPDRTWFTLAAYNVGLGHLRDARKITQQLGDNPNHWVDVKKHLPKLSQPQWYKQMKYGYARGYEPVQFVKQVRRFYDILVGFDSKSSDKLPISASQSAHDTTSLLN